MNQFHIQPVTPDLVVRLTGVSKQFQADRWLFRDLALDIPRGQLISLRGESGCGKSTLLNLIAGIETPGEGQISLCGQQLDGLTDAQASGLRARSIGFVFQAFHLLPNLPVWRNVALPLLLNGHSLSEARRRVREGLRSLGLADREQAAPAQLSGGEQQRVALLRALIHRPALVLADEPTGNLDPHTAAQALLLLGRTVRENGAAMLMVTHSEQAATICDRHLQLSDGKLIEDAEHSGGASDP